MKEHGDDSDESSSEGSSGSGSESEGHDENLPKEQLKQKTDDRRNAARKKFGEKYFEFEKDFFAYTAF